MSSAHPKSRAVGRRPAEVERWLRDGPPLNELIETFPEDWQAVQRELSSLAGRDDPGAVKAYIASLSEPPRPRPGARVRRQERERAAVSVQVRRQMAVAVLQRARLSAATGVKKGRVRFNLLNGYVAQKLLFERDLVRKPVALAAFRALWPLLWQRRYLMPLVEPKGVYCFYSRKLIRELARLVDGRACLEIAAGDGTLARFLADEHVDVTATDDHSWARSIEYPALVRRMDARTALRTFRPEVVICSFPPPGNGFEREVFRTPSVELYVVIASRDEFTAGDWETYRAQGDFDFAEDRRLGRLVLPPELDPAVYVFRRHRTAARP